LLIKAAYCEVCYKIYKWGYLARTMEAYVDSSTHSLRWPKRSVRIQFHASATLTQKKYIDAHLMWGCMILELDALKKRKICCLATNRMIPLSSNL